MRWEEDCSTDGEGRGAYAVLVGETRKKGTTWNNKNRSENNIKMDFQDVGWGAWIEMIWLMTGRGGGLL
jgi:hypothetical protein